MRSKRFPALGEAPEKLVLEALSLAVADGERVAVIGPSGCGKSTLLNIVAGLDRSFEGSRELARGTRLAYVFQEPRLLPWRSVADNLALVLGDEPGRAARIEAALNEVELADARDVYASRLSLGMARRAALARAFVTEPSLLLLDEPFVSLDEPTAQRLRLLLLDLLERHGTTALFVTHALREAIMVADRLVILSPAPARIVCIRDVPLRAAERRRATCVEAFWQALLTGHPEIAELLLPSASLPYRAEEIAR